MSVLPVLITVFIVRFTNDQIHNANISTFASSLASTFAGGLGWIHLHPVCTPSAHSALTRSLSLSHTHTNPFDIFQLTPLMSCYSFQFKIVCCFLLLFLFFHQLDIVGREHVYMHDNCVDTLLATWYWFSLVSHWMCVCVKVWNNDLYTQMKDDYLRIYRHNWIECISLSHSLTIYVNVTLW